MILGLEHCVTTKSDGNQEVEWVANHDMNSDMIRQHRHASIRYRPVVQELFDPNCLHGKASSVGHACKLDVRLCLSWPTP